MKKLTLATLSTLAFTLPCTNVFALDGTITVNGVITDQTCTLQATNLVGISGLKDITVTLPTYSKSWFAPPLSFWGSRYISLQLSNAEGTGICDAATMKAFKGIHLSAISPDDLDETDKRLLVNKAIDASTKNPIFMRIYARGKTFSLVDFSASWEAQMKSELIGDRYLDYQIEVFSKTGVVDAQNYTAKINYTMHYN